MYQTLLLIGPPGCGKGTVGKKLALVTGQIHLSSGDIFRGISKESEQGQLLRNYTDKGQLVPDEMTVEIVLNYVKGLIYTNRFNREKQKIILDGVPRTLKQAEMMQNAFALNKVLLLDVFNKQILFDRIKKRALAEGRQDDMKDEVLEKRYAIYKEQTEVLLKFYPKQNQVIVNADQTPTAVFRDVLIQLSGFFDHL